MQSSESQRMVEYFHRIRSGKRMEFVNHLQRLRCCRLLREMLWSLVCLNYFLVFFQVFNTVYRLSRCIYEPEFMRNKFMITAVLLKSWQKMKWKANYEKTTSNLEILFSLELFLEEEVLIWFVGTFCYDIIKTGKTKTTLKKDLCFFCLLATKQRNWKISHDKLSLITPPTERWNTADVWK